MFFDFSHFDRCNLWYLIMVSIYISLMNGGKEKLSLKMKTHNENSLAMSTARALIVSEYHTPKNSL